MDYVYLGDRLTDPRLKMKKCNAIRRADGKTIRGRNSNMLIELEDGELCIVIGRRLRSLKKIEK